MIIKHSPSWYPLMSPAKSQCESSSELVSASLNVQVLFYFLTTDALNSNSCTCSIGPAQRKATLKIEPKGTNALHGWLFWGTKGGGVKNENVLASGISSVETVETLNSWLCVTIETGLNIQDCQKPNDLNTAFLGSFMYSKVLSIWGAQFKSFSE